MEKWNSTLYTAKEEKENNFLTALMTLKGNNNMYNSASYFQQKNLLNWMGKDLEIQKDH